MVECEFEKIHSIILCHLSFLKKLSPIHTHPPISIHEFLKPYDSLFLEFESFLKYDVISMGGWVMQGLSGAIHTGVGWVMQKNNLK